MKLQLNLLILPLLLIGIVDQINGDVIEIEYVDKGRTHYSKALVSLSACKPEEGQQVYFYKDYKVVTCESVYTQ